MADGELLSAELVIEYPFSRTTGPVIGAFFTALREGFIVGIKDKQGRVLVPPFEYDPETSEALTEVVEVGDAGTVASWAWVEDPLEGQPFDRPFAFALITLDGADTPMLHAVDVADEADMSTGMRVKARWRDEREGHINDIECFVPEGASA